MIFSFPTLLPWLAVALLPWVLHLFLFRRAESLYFPSLFFLKQCHGWSTRLQLRRLLLLLTRSALILYFILGMLDPRMERAASTNEGRRAAGPVLFILDDRPAMRMKLLARTETLFDSYRQAALEELARRSESQEVAAISLSDLALRSPIRFGSPRDAAAKIRNASIQSLTPEVVANLRFALDRVHAQVLFYSPFHLALKDPDLSRVGPAPACEPNFSLLSLKAPDRIALGQPLSVHGEVTDFYGRPAEVPVRLSVDGREAAVTGAVRGRAAFLLTDIPAGRHWLKAQIVRPGSDGYPDDDARTLQIEVVSRQSVGFVTDRLPASLDAALRAFEQRDQTVRGLLKTPQDWESVRRAVALDLRATSLDLARKHVERGNELVIFADAFKSKTDADRIAALWKIQHYSDPDLATLPIHELLALGNGRAHAPTDIEPQDPRFVQMVRQIRWVAQPSDVVLAAFSDGSPAALRRAVGAGSVVMVAFSVEDPMLQTDPAYLLFVQSLLAAPDRPDESAGKTRVDAVAKYVEIPLQKNSSIPIGASAPQAAVRLVSESSMTTLTLGYAQGRFFAEIPSPAPPPGMYRLVMGSEEMATVFLYPTPPDPLALPETSKEMRRSMPFESFFFWIAVLLMAVELLLLRQMRAPADAA
ncbi:MAG: hypothetical protein A3G34_02395 [Candidatus Lindowbacteria bacterium RIFCSPLOWO2_12_FULL_62_27]|nr:MAG: hypothetical protein A3G34_02395 [Candidatus Lindowbacteria bacterium RIFCSPLOWO2_12_FULL_62_27]OGH62021.1 MAG: hypothetical protein A3I06_02180 [Candidatus Lindowbacteria bacterium RIFCSPLOWO2_02_FULL_62_12]